MGDEDVEHVAVPPPEGSVLVVVHAKKLLGLEKGPLDGPAKPRHIDHGLDRQGFGGVGQDVLGGSGGVLGLCAEEEEPFGDDDLGGALRNAIDPDPGGIDPFDAEGVRGADKLGKDRGLCESLHRDGSIRQDLFFRAFPPALVLRKDPFRRGSQNPGVGTDGGHVVKILGQGGEELPVRAEEGVDAHPAGLEQAACGGLAQKVRGDLGFGREGEVGGNAGLLPAFFELRTEPFLRHVEPGVDEAVGPLSHIAQEDPGLAVVDLAPGAAVLADHPDRLTPLLGELGEVDRVHGEFRVLGPDRFRKLLLVP